MSAPIAIVGMACRFPGAGSIDDFAALTRSGKPAIAPVPQARWDLCDRNDPSRIGLPEIHAGLVEDIDKLDRKLMRVSSNEAPLIDPMHRLFFEIAWEALEEAGVSPATLEGQPVGVFAGASNSEYALLQAMSGFPMAGSPYQNIGSSNSVIAGRFAYTLGLSGPVQVVDNACASSHTAVTAACYSLAAGDCDLAVAGGVHVMLSADVMKSLHATGVLAPDGVMRCFDSGASGYVRGEGCGVLALRRLDQAQARGDRIHAVIRGWHLRHNGRTNGMAAPSRTAQAASISAAVQSSGVEPAQIGYAEAHGTATRLGDLMEGAALHQALSPGRDDPLVVGAVKAQIGHLEAAAGSAGLIKAVLAVRDGVLPPLLGHESFPPDLAPPKASLRFPEQAEPWAEPERAAIVASLGYNGACSHIVLTSAPEAPIPPVKGPGLFLISAVCGDSLRARMVQLAGLLRAKPEHPVAALAQAVSFRWDGLSHRVALTAETVDAAILQVDEWLATADPNACRTRPGQGVSVQGEGLDPDIFPQATPARLSIVLADEAGEDTAGTTYVDLRDPEAIWRGVARVWLRGGVVDPTRIWSGVALIDVPAYPFQRSPAWALKRVEKND